MEIKLAKNSGFCFGVNRAINMINRIIETENKPIYTLGPIIHNPAIIEELNNKGVRVAKSVDEIPQNSIVIIRTHGISEKVLLKLKERNLTVFDATCPYVSKIQQIAKTHSQQGAAIIIAGNPNHPEVQGIKGFSKEAYIIESVDDIKTLFKNNQNLAGKPCVFVSQTTFNKREWRKIIQYVKKMYTSSLIFDTICNATEERQTEAEKIAKESEAVIVIGGKNSSNTTKLYEICKAICPNTYLIESSFELPLEKLKGFKIIGITAGASTPDGIIKEVYEKCLRM